jgi:hypothetical protein
LKKYLVRTLIWLAVVVFLFAAGLMLYAAHLRSSARELINSTSKVQSSADVEREIGIWKSQSGVKFWKDESAQNGDQLNEVRIENGLLSSLRIAVPTMLGRTIAMHDGNVRHVILVMFVGRHPSTTSGVWLQEWFASGSENNFHVNDSRKPWQATIDFSSTISATQRQRAFSINANCLVWLTGCKNAEEILPGVWQLATPANAGMYYQKYQ